MANDAKRGKKCSCCNSATFPKKQYFHQHEKNILNKGIRELNSMMDSYRTFPVLSKDVSLVARIYYKGITYQIPFSALIRYAESYNNCFVGDKGEFWSDDMIKDNSISHQLSIAIKKMEIVGIGR